MNGEGKGPAWANALFEANAEHGFGMYLGQKAIRDRLASKMRQLAEVTTHPDKKEICEKWLETKEDGEENAAAPKC